MPDNNSDRPATAEQVRALERQLAETQAQLGELRAQLERKRDDNETLKTLRFADWVKIGFALSLPVLILGALLLLLLFFWSLRYTPVVR